VIASEVGDRRGEGAALGNLGNRYAELGEPRRAIELFEQALAIFREVGDRRGEGEVLHNLSAAYQRVVDLPAAIQTAEASLTMREEIEVPRVADTRAQLDDLRVQLGQAVSPAAPGDELPP
jgi:tetratricopeptide (TPR) repeat protein